MREVEVLVIGGGPAGMSVKPPLSAARFCWLRTRSVWADNSSSRPICSSARERSTQEHAAMR